MTPSKSDHDALEILSRRHELLERLAEGARHKRDLVDDLEVSRSTVHRGIRQLESIDFVERRDGTYRLTVPGRLALVEHRRRVTALESIAAVSDLLGAIPRDAPMSVRFLEEATTLEPEPHAPNAPYEVIVDRLAVAERLRAITAAERDPQFRRRLHERTVEGDLDAEVIFTNELAAFFLDAHGRQLREVMADGAVDCFAVESTPYGLWIVETATRSEAFVVVHGEAADIRGVIRNGTDRAIDWADGVYRNVRERARRLDPP